MTSEAEKLKAFMDVVSRIPATVTCCKCGREEDNGPGGTVDVRSGFEVITDPVTGHRSRGGHICGDCMTGKRSQ